MRFVDALDDREDLAYDDRSEAEGRLVEHHDLRLRHEGAGDGEHLLLTTGQGAGELPRALLQPREHAVDLLDVCVEGIVPKICTDLNVLEDGHIREDVTPFRAEHDALLHTLRGRHIRDILAIENDASFARLHQSGNYYATYVSEIRQEHAVLSPDRCSVVLKEIPASLTEIYRKISSRWSPYIETVYGVLSENGHSLAINEFTILLPCGASTN